MDVDLAGIDGLTLAKMAYGDNLPETFRELASEDFLARVRQLNDLAQETTMRMVEYSFAPALASPAEFKSFMESRGQKILEALDAGKAIHGMLGSMMENVANGIREREKAGY